MTTFRNMFTKINEVLITFGGKAYPKFGNIVILAGGAGSGKGFVAENLLGIEGKVLDVDALKQLLKKTPKIRAKVKEETGYEITDLDLKVPKNVSILHKIVKQFKLDTNKKAAFYTSIISAEPSRKPNIIFDVTLDSLSKLYEITKEASALGYEKENIHIVWVVNDVKVALEQNKSRDRVVPEDILVDTHEGAALTMKKIIGFGSDIKKYMNGAIVLAFNKKGVDSTVKSNDTGGFYVVDSAYINVKDKGKSIDLDKITKPMLNKIKSYTPVPDKWA